MSSDFKNMLLLVVLLGAIYYAHIVIKKYYNKDVHCTTSVSGKILEYKITTGLSVYYNYRYHYNGKVFNEVIVYNFCGDKLKEMEMETSEFFDRYGF